VDKDSSGDGVVTRRSLEDLGSTKSGAALLRESGILLLEPQSYAFGALPQLIHAAHDAAFLARREGLGREVADAVFEAGLDHGLVGLKDGRKVS
jgi:hypothetical protein